MVDETYLTDEQIRPFIVYALQRRSRGFYRLSKDMRDSDNDDFHYSIGVEEALRQVVSVERLAPLWDAIAAELYPDQFEYFHRHSDYQI